MSRSRGFVTIATGKNSLFTQLAFNLKRTYDYQSQSKRFPWAVITDHEEEEWRVFEKIIHLDDATGSYLDKIKMLSTPPWDENIFIDADSLIYGDISHLFSVFPLTGTRHIGEALPTTADGKGWFDMDGIGEYQKEITFKIHSHGGIVFFNKDDTTQLIYQTALTITKHWAEYHFREFSNPADEPILALSMCVHNCSPLPLDRNDILCFYRVDRDIKKININKGILSFRSKWNGTLHKNVPIMHWGTKETKGSLYKSEMVRFNHSGCYLIKKVIWTTLEKTEANINHFKSMVYRFLHIL